jgi:alkanesulfonate monooxygenase SsuD/methylene tetrahydromethanopterin reductase-like flavin-dependent oxidoreductase (luciferase family)
MLVNSADKLSVEGASRTPNPLFNDRKLKLATFGSNVKSGCAITAGEGALPGDWPTSLQVAKIADAMEFEAIVPVGRFRGVGGDTDYGGTSFEPYTFAAALASQTKHPMLFSTSHVPTIHPILAAKQGATIDHVSGGRFALNIVTGWNKTEIEMFGVKMLEHDARYDCAAEWLEIVKLLWTREEAFDYEGKFYKISKALLKPQPLQVPHPPVMCAGGSPKGRHFAAKYCDIVFTAFERRANKDEMAQGVESFRDIARTDYDREIKVWSSAYVVQGETEAEAKKLFDYYVHEKADAAGADNMVEMLGLHSQSWSKEGFQNLKDDLIAGWGSYPLVGTAEQIRDGLQLLSDAGVDGLVLSWPGYESGIEQFAQKVMPLLKQSGLR